MTGFQTTMYWVGIFASTQTVIGVSWLIWMLWSIDRVRKPKKRRCKDCWWLIKTINHLSGWKTKVSYDCTYKLRDYDAENCKSYKRKPWKLFAAK